MKVKQMIRKGGRWVEAYVDNGPGRARVGHGSPMRMIQGQRVGPVRPKPAN